MDFIRHILMNFRRRVCCRYINAVPRLFSNGPPFRNHNTVSFTVGITRVLHIIGLIRGCVVW